MPRFYNNKVYFIYSFVHQGCCVVSSFVSAVFLSVACVILHFVFNYWMISHLISSLIQIEQIVLPIDWSIININLSNKHSSTNVQTTSNAPYPIPNCEVKRGWGDLVLWWVTTWETSTDVCIQHLFCSFCSCCVVLCCVGGQGFESSFLLFFVTLFFPTCLFHLVTFGLNDDMKLWYVQNNGGNKSQSLVQLIPWSYDAITGIVSEKMKLTKNIFPHNRSKLPTLAMCWLSKCR